MLQPEALEPTVASTEPRSDPARPEAAPVAGPPAATVPAWQAEADQAVLAAGAPPAASAPTEAPAATRVDGYVLRRSLTRAPVPTEEIRLSWPEGSVNLERQQAVFSVFIDESGAVRRMVADAPTLSPSIEAAAREVFMAARFEPGQLNGRAVKSLIRVEVVFDNSVPVAAAGPAASGPAPTARPAIVSRQNL